MGPPLVDKLRQKLGREPTSQELAEAKAKKRQRKEEKAAAKAAKATLAGTAATKAPDMSTGGAPGLGNVINSSLEEQSKKKKQKQSGQLATSSVLSEVVETDVAQVTASPSAVAASTPVSSSRGSAPKQPRRKAADAFVVRPAHMAITSSTRAVALAVNQATQKLKGGRFLTDDAFRGAWMELQNAAKDLVAEATACLDTIPNDSGRLDAESRALVVAELNSTLALAITPVEQVLAQSYGASGARAGLIIALRYP